jgi:hypothetical protein
MHLCLDFAKKIREFKCTKSKDLSKNFKSRLKKIQPHILMHLVFRILCFYIQLRGMLPYIQDEHAFYMVSTTNIEKL